MLLETCEWVGARRIHPVKRMPIVANLKVFVSAWNGLAWNVYRMGASSRKHDRLLICRYVYLDDEVLGCGLEGGTIAALDSATSVSVEGLMGGVGSA